MQQSWFPIWLQLKTMDKIQKKQRWEIITGSLGKEFKFWRKTRGDKFSIVLIFSFTCRLWSLDKLTLGNYAVGAVSQNFKRYLRLQEKTHIPGWRSLCSAVWKALLWFLFSLYSLAASPKSMHINTEVWTCAGGYNFKRTPFF